MRKSLRKFEEPGLTLMEVVVALGVIAVTVPIILTATVAATGTRASAEADTRSAWLAKEVQRQIIANWDSTEISEISTDLTFPEFASSAAPIVLLYDGNGEFLVEGGAQDLVAPSTVNRAAYLVTFYGESYVPQNLTGSADVLSLLRMEVLHPAKAAPESRNAFRYHLLTPEGGIF